MDNIRNYIDEARRLVKLCQHAADVGDYLALAEMALEAQRRTSRLHEAAKVVALRQARTDLAKRA